MADEIIAPDEAAAKTARRKAYHAQWRANNPERWKEIVAKSNAKNRDKRAASDARWVAANPDRVKAKMDRWREANRETARTATIKWRANHPDRARAAVKRWNAANPEQHKAIKASRRAREMSAEGTFTGSDIKTMFARQRAKCVYCNVALNGGYHIDHIIPLAKGGTNWPKNLQLTCKKCNQKKHAKHPIEFARSIGLLV